MNQTEKAETIYRIISGINEISWADDEYIVKNPDIDILYKATKMHNDIVRKLRYNDEWLSAGEIDRLLLSQKLIPPNIDEVIKEMGKQVEDIKVSMYKSYLKKEILAMLRTRLKLLKDKLNETVNAKHMFDYVTSDGYAIMLKNQFVLANTLFFKDGTKVFDSFENADYRLLDNIMSVLNDKYLTSEEIRELARTEPWRPIWSNSKEKAVQGVGYEWTDEQRAIISYSRMYDSIYDNPECPSDEILEDDDILDGWLINLRRTREKDKKTSELENWLGDKYKDAGEVFLPASNQENAQEIFDLNSEHMRQLKAQRDKAIRDRGVLNEAELPDVMLDRVVQVNR